MFWDGIGSVGVAFFLNSFDLVTYWRMSNFQREQGGRGCPKRDNEILSSELDSSVQNIIKVILKRCVSY